MTADEHERRIENALHRMLGDSAVTNEQVIEVLEIIADMVSNSLDAARRPRAESEAWL